MSDSPAKNAGLKSASPSYPMSDTFKSLNDKKILVIGGSSGFGLATARLADSLGARLLIVGRDEAKALQVADTLSKAIGRGLDASNPDELKALLEEFGPIDHAISMVGGAMGGGFLEADVKTIRATIEGKFFDNLNIARTLAPYINEGGSLVLTAGSGGRPDNASGAIIGNDAITSLVKGLGVELAPKVRANAVAPTWTPTGLWRDLDKEQVDTIHQSFCQQIPLGRTGEPEEVAQAYVFLMQCSFITGQTLVVDGGLTLVS